MAKMLKVNVRLREIHLAHYDMRDFGAERLKENLIDNLMLTHLDVRRYGTASILIFEYFNIITVADSRLLSLGMQKRNRNLGGGGGGHKQRVLWYFRKWKIREP